VERNVLEHAYAVYREHGKRLKTQRDRAARSGAQDLVVRYVAQRADAGAVAPCPGSRRGRSLPQRAGWCGRYQYKIAVYAELRQDTKTALKYFAAPWPKHPLCQPF